VPRTLLSIGWRTLLRRPWQTLLMILGITLGVAVVVAVDLANVSAVRAFDLSTDAVAGRATHQIVAGPQGLDETVYVALRRSGLTCAAAPVVTEIISSPDLGGETLQLLGIDPFAEPPFRSYLAGARDGPDAGWSDFLTQPGAILLSTPVAERYGLAPGARLTLEVSGYERDAFVAGLVQPGDRLSRRALDGLVLSDIATAQELTGRLGRLDHVDLILPDDGGAAAARIEARLPPGARITAIATRTGAARQMTAAFRLNLTALSLLALVVGMFLIYNTMTFSVVQRRALFGTLRCLGLTRREVFGLVVGEALLLGAIGAGLGLALGVVMGRSAVRMVTQTINDLYYLTTVRNVGAQTGSLVKGGLLGLVATATAAALPAWEAASVPPRAALSRSGLEAKARQAVGRVAAGGAALLLLSGGLLALPTRDLIVSFAGTSGVVVGAALLTPLATALLMRLAGPIVGRLWGALGRLAPRNVVSALSRTAVAVVALTVAVSVTIGVSLMIGSFRYTVVVWLAHALQGDVYVSASSLTATQDPAPIDVGLLEAVERVPEVAWVDRIRSLTVDSPSGPVYVEAGDSPSYGDDLLYLSADGPPEETWDAVHEGAVIVSEPLAVRLDLPPHGGEVTLYTARGPRTFPVAGIYYDYASTEGAAILSLDTYRELWEDDSVTALVLGLTPGADPDAVAQQLQRELTALQRVLVRPNQALRQEALAIFDRTFAITGALQLLATGVAFIGVLSALLSLQLDKQRQLGVLRALGLTGRELRRLIVLETGLMGTVAGLLAMPTGYVLSLILIYIINRRSFGWTLQMRVVPAPFLEAFGVAVAAAVLAGIYPAYRMSRMATAEALRYE